MTSTSELRETATSRPSVAFLVGPVVGVAGFVAMFTVGAGFSVTDDLPVSTMLEKLENAEGMFLVGGGFQALVAMGLVLFGGYVRSALARREPSSALTPYVAFGGALLTASMTASAAAITQLAGGFNDAVDPAIPLTLHALEENLFAGAWCSLALVAGAIAVAGLRRGSVARWFAGLSAFVAILLVVAQVVVPWAAWFPAVIWLTVSTLALRERAA